MGLYRYYDPTIGKRRALKSVAIVNSDGTNEYTPNQIKAIEDDLVTHKAEKATQDGYGHIRLQDVANAIDSKVRVVDNEAQICVNGTWLTFIKIDDQTNAPGRKFLLGGTMDAGYFGEVPMSELITGDSLASKIGLSAGTSQFSDTAGWLKFAYNGKIQFVAKKPLRYNLSWDNINSANAVYGDKTIVIDGLTYKVRLMKGANKDPAGAYNGSINHGSEWNKLMLPIHTKAKDGSWAHPGNVEPNIPYWGIHFTDEDLLTHYNHGSGSRSWCQEIAASSDNRLLRGGSGVSLSASDTSSRTHSGYGWRPCLELVS